MTNLLAMKSVVELKENPYRSYLVREEYEFYNPVGYKVMQSKSVSPMIEAVKLRYNGILKFIYITKDYESCSSIIHKTASDIGWRLCCNILDAVQKIKNQGFLLCENIDFQLEHIYFVPNTYEAKLIYLPLKPSGENYEREVMVLIKQLMLNILSECHIFDGGIDFMLKQDNSSLEDLIKEFGRHTSGASSFTGSADKQLHLISMTSGLNYDFTVRSDRFTVGRVAGNDGVLAFETDKHQISRTQFEIVRKNGNYYVADNTSSHRTTMLNDKRLVDKNKYYPINEGDIISIPKIKFRVSFN